VQVVQTPDVGLIATHPDGYNGAIVEASVAQGSPFENQVLQTAGDLLVILDEALAE
jgi:hypothetical protein